MKKIILMAAVAVLLVGCEKKNQGGPEDSYGTGSGKQGSGVTTNNMNNPGAGQQPNPGGGR